MTAQQTTSRPFASDKATYVRDMFAGIAGRYDLLNDVLSFRRHRAWRRFAVRLARLAPGDSVLDVCTGTGDFALDLDRAVGAGGTVIGSDFCLPMLRIGHAKAAQRRASAGTMVLSDAQELPFASDRFDCVTVGFGIRNVADTLRAFRETARVARPGGRVVCLEFTQPRHPVWGPVCAFYQNRVLPAIGGLLSRREAYTYLPSSIETFHTREQLADVMRAAGLTNIQVRDLNFGSVCIHLGTKP